MPFPVVKLFYLAVRQLSKPLAAGLKHRAKVSPFFRNKLIIPLGQGKIVVYSIIAQTRKLVQS